MSSIKSYSSRNRHLGSTGVARRAGVWQYLANADRARFQRVMAAAGRVATPDNPAKITKPAAAAS